MPPRPTVRETSRFPNRCSRECGAPGRHDAEWLRRWKKSSTTCTVSATECVSRLIESWPSWRPRLEHIPGVATHPAFRSAVTGRTSRTGTWPPKRQRKGRSTSSPRSGYWARPRTMTRSEEHTSELQSLTNLVCRLLLEKKKKNKSVYGECVDFSANCGD